MTTGVAYKWARDDAAAQIGADGTVSWSSTKLSPGEDDHAAIAVAVAVAGDGEVVGVTLGDGDASWALARRVGRAVVVADAPTVEDDAATATFLAGAVRHLAGVDVLVVGDSEHHCGVAPAVAGHLGWPVLLGVVAAERTDGEVAATRRVGAREETVRVRPPVVLGVMAESAERSAPGMKEMLAARKRPVEKVTLDDLGLSAPATVQVNGTRRPESGTARIFADSPDETAAELAKVLRSEGVA